MSNLPEYIGPAAFGIKMGVIVPGADLSAMVVERATACHRDQLLDNGDVLCITESVVARAQNNYVSTQQVADELRHKLDLGPGKRVGVVFPIASRNRFSLVLEAVARAVPQGEVIVQLSWPRDEVGNQIIGEDLACRLGKGISDPIYEDELRGLEFKHPITKVDYIALYRETIANAGCKAKVCLCNDPRHILTFAPAGVLVADIHTRDKTRAALAGSVKTVMLSELCSTPGSAAWSEWGLLGSNMSSGNRLKLAPRNASQFAREVQHMVAEATGIKVEVIIYGDGAYKDPSSQIYELADPQPVFGATPGFSNVMREGFKYKYLADLYHQQGKTAEEIEELLRGMAVSSQDQVEAEGTTPRRMEDVVASLADLVSGSADAGTPLVLVKGFFR